MEYTAKLLQENFWVIDQGGVRCFLFVGEEKAVLIDTGFGGDLKAVCDVITDNPIVLITTHSDRDHIGSDEQFPEQYMHPAEFDAYERRSGKPTHAKPIWEGDTITVGGYTLEVVLAPGHTPGSIMLLEREKKFIISGDSLQTGTIYLFGDGRNLKAFRASMTKLEKLWKDGAFDTIYPSHGSLDVPADVIPDHIALADALLAGTLEPIGPGLDRFPSDVQTYEFGRVKMYYAK